jgi:hypothetical protein
MTHHEFARYDPHRAPDWRLRRVRQLLEAPGGPRRPHRLDDEYIGRYRKFLLTLSATLAQAEQEVAGTARQFHEHPALAAFVAENADIYYAHQLHFASDQEGRFLVQARILARESDDEIARRLAMPAGAVAWYESMFFHVRDRFDAGDWIEKAVIRPLTLQPAIPDPAADAQALSWSFIRHLAYFGGSLVLDAALDELTSTEPPGTADQVPGRLSEAFQGALTFKTMAAVFEGRLSPIQLMKLQAKLAKLPVSKAAGGDKDISPHIEAMLKLIPWQLAETPPRS